MTAEFITSLADDKPNLSESKETPCSKEFLRLSRVRQTLQKGTLATRVCRRVKLARPRRADSAPSTSKDWVRPRRAKLAHPRRVKLAHPRRVKLARLDEDPNTFNLRKMAPSRLKMACRRSPSLK